MRTAAHTKQRRIRFTHLLAFVLPRKAASFTGQPSLNPQAVTGHYKCQPRNIQCLPTDLSVFGACYVNASETSKRRHDSKRCCIVTVESKASSILRIRHGLSPVPSWGGSDPGCSPVPSPPPPSSPLPEAAPPLLLAFLCQGLGVLWPAAYRPAGPSRSDQV